MNMNEEASQENFDLGFEADGEKKEAHAANDATPPIEEAQAAEETQPGPVQQEEAQPIAEKPEPAQEAKPAMLAEAPQNIAEELENLRKLNPEAATLAMEDSPDGEAIRKRLETYETEHAQDRAEMTLYMRQEQIQKKRQAQARIEEANRNFVETLKREAPDYFALVNDPSRRAEAVKYIQSLDD